MSHESDETVRPWLHWGPGWQPVPTSGNLCWNGCPLQVWADSGGGVSERPVHRGRNACCRELRHRVRAAIDGVAFGMLRCSRKTSTAILTNFATANTRGHWASSTPLSSGAGFFFVFRCFMMPMEPQERTASWLQWVYGRRELLGCRGWIHCR